MPFSNNSKQDVGLLIQLHTTEYTNLSSRATNYINLIYVILGAFFAYAGFIIYLWPKMLHQWYSPFLPWGAVLGWQCLAYAAASVNHEAMFIVFYIESYLRPMIEQLLGTNAFFKYEGVLRNYRNFKPWAQVEYYWFSILLAAVLYIGAFHGHWDSWLGWAGAIVNAGFLVALFRRLYASIELRYNFTADQGKAKMAL